jgi:hypothetical protein
MQKSLLFSTVLSCLILSWFFTRMGAKYYCNDSRVVESLVIVDKGADGEVTRRVLPKCGVQTRISQILRPIAVPEGFSGIWRQIQSWEVNWRALGSRPFSLYDPTLSHLVLDFQGTSWQRGASGAIIGIDTLKAQGGIGRSLNYLMLSKWAPESPQIWRQVLSDILWFWQTGERPSFSAHWTTYLKSEAEFCKDHRVLAYAKEGCPSIPSGGVSLLSLRPFFSEKLHQLLSVKAWRTYSLLRSWLIQLPESAEQFRILNWQGVQDATLVQLDHWVGSVVHILQRETGQRLSQRQSQWDALVVLFNSNIKPSFPDSYKGSVAFLRPDQGLQFWPSQVLFEGDPPKSWSFRQIFWVDCKAPKLESLWSLKKYGTQVTYIKLCGDFDNIDWSQLLVKGPKAHRNQEYAKLYLPSLELAQRLYGHQEFSRWPRWLRWQGLKTHGSTYHPLAVHPGVTEFRYPEWVQ